MKKVLMLFVLLLTASILLIGCSTKKEKAGMNLEKAQKVEIESLTDSSEKKVITDKKEIEKLFEVMKMDKWEMQSAPLDTSQGKHLKCTKRIQQNYQSRVKIKRSYMKLVR